MTDIVDLSEVFSETLARVRARMDADANMGLTTDDPALIDTREGTFYWDMTQPPAMECARLWDAMTETVAAAFPSTAWGDYLDEHGATFGLTRSPAIASTGQLTFIASEATLIGAGTQASSVASTTGDTNTYETTEGGTTNDPLPIPSGVTVTLRRDQANNWYAGLCFENLEDDLPWDDAVAEEWLCALFLEERPRVMEITEGGATVRQFRLAGSR